MTEQEIIALLGELVRTPSPTFEEEAASQLIFDFLEAEGASPCRFGKNVVAVCEDFDSTKPVLMLNSHLDTVPPVSGWTRDPYCPEVVNDALFGLGSNDAGGCVVSLIAAFMELRKEVLPVNLLLALTVEEERGGPGGMRLLLPALAAEGITPQMAIVGEPTSLQAGVAERGLVVLDCITRGVAGHAARATGENALYRALDDISAVRAMEFPYPSPLLGQTRAIVTQIEAGERHNVIPDLCRWVVDIRTTDTCSNEAAIEAVAAVLGSHTEMTPRSTRIRASVLNDCHPLAEAAFRVGAEAFVSPTTSDMSLLHGIPALKLGPGHSSLSHTPDEHLPLDMLRRAPVIYSKIIRNIK